MALFTGQPRSAQVPSGRYLHSNPLRREFGLRLLTASLPEPLGTTLIRAWRQPGRFPGEQEMQSLHRRQMGATELAPLAPKTLAWYVQVELEVSRRVVEAPIASISRGTRNGLLTEQGAYLRRLYDALAGHVGAYVAQAEFARLLARVD
jgi:hypothetical protein